MIKKDLIKRLNIIEGHINGIKKMIDDERDCRDIITQTKAVKSSLNKVETMIIKKYAIKCLQKDDVDIEEKLSEIISLITK